MFLLQIKPLDPKVLTKADSVKTSLVQQVESFSSMSVEELLRTVTSGIISVVLKVVVALLIFFIGRWIIRRIRKLISRVMERREVDISLRSFLLSLVNITLMLFLIITIIGVLGIDTTSFIALFASAGLAIGMALSGTLQNFAGGVMILLFRPFRVGDTIEAQGESGTVKSIQLIHTVLNTLDNKTILLPNGPTSTGVINNYSQEERRRVEWVFGIGYGNDYDLARTTIAELLEKDERIHRDPEPLIALKELGPSSVNIVVRGWTATDNFWPVYFALNEAVYKLFAERGLNIPFPQMDVHLYRDGERPQPAQQQK